jgi:hypothetical protein
MRGKTPKERYAILLTSVQGRRGDPTVLEAGTQVDLPLAILCIIGRKLGEVNRLASFREAGRLATMSCRERIVSNCFLVGKRCFGMRTYRRVFPSSQSIKLLHEVDDLNPIPSHPSLPCCPGHRPTHD